ncbi:outer membrane beta-barrel protein [Mucilaginibacter sp. L196]|uniref:outer membrane beta-barrel protein n=1 Tax=Mucilaginibacter sp. L196 TaxID=1641870 RepID=UPI00131C5D65|nr:outer membrane beta-barrel protein [Mucilaginibacter sp. L196]
MKDSAWYNKLWQTKMQELPLQGDEHGAWQKMQGLLDQHMPVNSPVITPKAGTSLWVKLMYVLATIISAAILYYAATRILAHHHEKTNKPIGKHAQIITDSAANKSNLATTGSSTGNAVYSTKNAASSNTIKSNVKQNMLNSSVQPGKFPSANNSNVNGATTNVNKVELKHITNNAAISNVKSSGVNNKAAGGSSTPRNRIVNHFAPRGNSGAVTTPGAGLYNPGLQRGVSQYHSTNQVYSKVVKRNTGTSKSDQQLLADQNLIRTNGVASSNTGNAIAGASTNGTTQNVNATNSPAKTDNPTAAKSAAAKQVADAKVKNQSNKSGAKSKASVAKKTADSKFTVDINLGANTNKGSNLNPFLGVMGNYQVHNKWGIAIGANVLSTRIISGSYGKSNLNYITIGDSSKKITHNSGQLTINSTRKIVYVDVPVLVTYKVSDKFTIKAGPVISIPIKTEANKNTLGPLSSSADTTTIRTVTPYVNSTTISSKVNFSFSAGAQYTIKRFYFDATYLQGLSPYTIGSGLGSGKIYYRTVQVGIGYHLFKSKRQ